MKHGVNPHGPGKQEANIEGVYPSNDPEGTNETWRQLARLYP